PPGPPRPLSQFVFPMDALRRRSVVSANGSGGKRAIRVYPPWVTPTNRQASSTQAWQLSFFLHLHQDGPINLARAQELYTRRTALAPASRHTTTDHPATTDHSE
ncbi:MepB family protein, partial [Streptomyces turgidiscabies]